MTSIDDKDLPLIKAVPGRFSAKLADRLRAVESAGISGIQKGLEPLFLSQAHGAVLEDVDGNRLLDFTSSFGVVGVGHRHPRVEAAIREQASTLIYTMPGTYPHVPYVNALESIKNCIGRWDNTEVLMTNTGSEAVEVALKLSLCHTGRSGLVAFQGAFHGQSIGALTVTANNELRNPFSTIISKQITFIPYPDPYRPVIGDVDSVLNLSLELLKNALSGKQSGGTPIGAVLVEPMQNAAGYIVPPEGFLREVRRLCNEFSALLIFDEIFTGFGRNGYWLSADREEVVPDIVCVGKSMTGGIPAAACVADHEIMDSLSHGGIIPLHGSTFVSNPIACSAITATLETLRKEKLIKRSSVIGTMLKAEITKICEGYKFVGDVRGLGSAIAIEFVKDPETKERDEQLAWLISGDLLSKHGVATLVTGLPYGNILSICPPFVATEKQCSYFLEALADSLSNIRNNHRKTLTG